MNARVYPLELRSHGSGCCLPK